MDIFVLFLVIGPSFHFFHHSMVVSSGFFIDSLIRLNKFPYTLIFFGAFSHERIFGFIKCFFLNALISYVCSLLI